MGPISIRLRDRKQSTTIEIQFYSTIITLTQGNEGGDNVQTKITHLRGEWWDWETSTDRRAVSEYYGVLIYIVLGVKRGFMNEHGPATDKQMTGTFIFNERKCSYPEPIFANNIHRIYTQLR